MMRLFKSAIAATAIVFVMLSGSAAPQVHAAAAAPCTLTPVLLDTTMNQGLQSYSQLVRGKETLVRFYFGLPSCAAAGNAIQINSAKLTVKNQSASGVLLTPTPVDALAPIGTSTPPLITSTVKQIDATSDPKWVVDLVGPTTSSFNASFEATLNYQSKTCATCPLSGAVTSAPYSIAPGTRSTLITKTVAARTNALRLLIVPMGLPPTAPTTAPTATAGSGGTLAAGTYTYKVSSTSIVGESPLSAGINVTVGGNGSVQLTWPAVSSASGYKVYRNDGSVTGDVLIASIGQTTSYTDNGGGRPAVTTPVAQQTLENALTVLSRGGPFSDSGGRLGPLVSTASTAGIRYTLNAGFVDLSAMLAGGQFCGNNGNFPTIESTLSSTLQTFNSLNGSNAADKVIGVVDGSLAIPSALNVNCFEGEASPGGVDAWIRLAPDNGGTISLSGAVLMQELAHLYGIEPFSRSNGAYHSLYTTAHGTSGDPGKTYNVLERAYVKSDGSTASQNLDRTALISNISNGITNFDILFENADWNDQFCFLGGPVPSLTGSACTSTSIKSGTAVGVAASAGSKAIVLDALTDGTKGGTTGKLSFTDDNMLLTGPDPNSTYHIVERDSGGAIVVNFLAPAAPAGGHSHTDFDVDSSQVLISAAVTRPDTAATLELWKGTPGSDCGASPSCLYSSTKIGNTAPTISSGTPTATTSDNQPITAGGTATVTKTISIDAIPKTYSKPDTYLLADTTGSMTDAIGDVKSSANAIVDNFNGKTGTDPCFGVGDYKDFLSGDSYAFNNALTFAGCAGSTQSSAAATAIGAWGASGGNDDPEAQLYALHQIATGAAAYESDSQKLLIWFGDQPGHDPICGSVYDPSAEVPPPNIVTDSVAIELHNAGITVYPIGVTPDANAFKALDAIPNSAYPGCAGDATGNQATRIANATGGVVTLAPSNQVSETILKILNNEAATVVPSTSGCTPGMSVSFTPTSQKAITPATMTFTENVTVAAGSDPGTYTCHVHFSVNGTVNPAFDQTLTYDVTSLSGPHTLITWTANDDSTAKLHGTVALKCNNIFHILAPNVLSDDDGHFFYDTTRGCQGGEYYVTANDGWFKTALTPVATSSIANTPAPPVVGIDSPTGTSRILQFGVLPVAGAGRSYNGAALTPSQLVFKLDGIVVGSVNSVFTAVPTPTGFDLRPKTANGWGTAATNTHELILEGTDGNGNGTGTAKLTFQTLGDNDDDGVSTAQEDVIHACGGSLPPDQDPYNATQDYDGDGLPNASDPAPCTAETDYEATALFSPSRFDVSSAPSFAIGGIFTPYLDLKQIPKSTVRISKVAGIDVTGPEWFTTAWVVSGRFDGTVGVAGFNGAPLANFIGNLHPELLNHTIVVTVVGTTADGSKGFHADASVYVFKSK